MRERTVRDWDALQAQLESAGIEMDLSNEEVRSFFGDEGDEDEEWMGTWGYDMLSRYAGQYVAVKDRQVVASAESLDGLYNKLEVEAIKYVLVSYIEDPDVVVIY